MRILVMLGMCVLTIGCRPSKETQPSPSMPTVPAVHVESEEEWDARYTQIGYGAANKMYECIDEMIKQMARDVHIGRGPVCQDACRKYAEMINEEQEHPGYFAQLGLHATKMPDRNVCTLRKGKK